MPDYPALAIQAPNVVGNYLGGMQQAQDMQGQAVRNQLLQDEQAQRAATMQRDEQFRNLLAQSVGPMAAGAAQAPGAQPPAGYEGGGGNYLMQGMENSFAPAPDTFNQLLQLDPERALQLQSHFEQQRAQQQAQLRERAGVSVRAAQFVLKAKDPKRTLEIGFPEMVEQLKSQGTDFETLTDEEVRSMAGHVIDQFGPIAGIGPAGDGEQFTLGQGQKRFDSSGNEIASVEAAPDDKDPTDKTFTRATKLADDFRSETGGFNTVRSAWENVKSAKSGDAGDTALVLNFMRTISPGIRIQPGEAITDAASVPGVSDKAIGLWNKLVSGGKLSDSQRAELKDQARSSFNTQKALYDKTVKTYRERAKRYGVPEEDVVGESASDEPAGGGAPPAAVAYLREHPESAQHFKEKYGYLP